MMTTTNSTTTFYITVKMYTQDPHKVCASVKLNEHGRAVGYFIEEHERPAFLVDGKPTIYLSIIDNIASMRPVGLLDSVSKDRWLAFGFDYYGALQYSRCYDVPFCAEDANGLYRSLQRFFGEHRALILDRRNHDGAGGFVGTEPEPK